MIHFRSSAARLGSERASPVTGRKFKIRATRKEVNPERRASAHRTSVRLPRRGPKKSAEYAHVCKYVENYVEKSSVELNRHTCISKRQLSYHSINGCFTNSPSNFGNNMSIVVDHTQVRPRVLQLNNFWV